VEGGRQKAKGGGHKAIKIYWNLKTLNPKP